MEIMPVTSGNLSSIDPGLPCNRTDELAPEAYTVPPAELQPDLEETLHHQAITIARQGDHLGAIQVFSQLIGQNAGNAAAYHNRGLAYFQIRQFNAALADYTTALQLNPRLGKVYNSRGNCYAAMGNLEEAIFDYEAAIDLNPLDLHACINRGITFRELKLYELALENFDLAFEFSQLLNPTETRKSIRLLQGHINAERGRTHDLAGDWNWAVADYQQALATLPNSNGTETTLSHRLRLQVNHWLNDLLSGLVG